MDEKTESRFREPLAEYAHNAWSGWMDYLFSKCRHNEDGTCTIPDWAVERWQRQASTVYADLPEDEKQSDRAEADKMLVIFCTLTPKAKKASKGEKGAQRRKRRPKAPNTVLYP